MSIVSNSCHKREPLASQTSKLNSILSNQKTQKRHNKSIVDISGTSALFQLSQSEVHFINTQLNEAYEISMTVRNVSENSQKIKIRQPKLSCFTLSTSKEGMVAPGLQVKLTIGYQNKNNEEVTDRIVIIAEQEYEVEIPIYVYPQVSKLVFDPFINFGFIKTGTSKEVIVPIENIGTMAADVKLQAHLVQGTLRIEPEQLKIEPKEKRSVKVTIYSKDIGEIDGTIQIEPKQLSLSEIEFVANFCEFNRFITDDQGIQIEQINVKPLFAGQKTKIVNHLVNNSPKICEFRISRKKGTSNQDHNQLVTPQEFGKEQAEKLLSISPSIGELEAYSSVELITEIQAKYDDNDAQMFCNYVAGKLKVLPYQYKQWSYFLTTHFSDEQNHQKIQLKGISVIPKISLNNTFLKFGQAFVKSRSQKFLRVENYSIKSVQIQFEKSSNYKFVPEKCQIDQKMHKEVCVIFSPKVVGDLNETIMIRVGEFQFPFKLFGKGKFGQEIIDQSKSEELKPQDLDPSFLENQISLINDSKEKAKKESYADSSSTTIHFDTYRNNSEKKGESILSSSTTKQKKHNKFCLRGKNGKEEKIDINNFDSQRQPEEYLGHPKNQQEERLVNRDMSSAELKNIPVGPVVISIGDIFLKATQTRYFHICNFNSKAISIQLDSNNLPMFDNTPKARQILPGQSHGGLKIVFEALAEGQFRYPLQYILNGKHFFELVITGRVIEPVLSLSRTEIRFIASEDERNFEKVQIVALSNTHKYPAEFCWKISKESLFKITPPQGVVQPNQKINIQILHNFLNLAEPGGKVQENLKLKVTHGKSNYLKCTSIVPQCSCLCKPNQINFRQICISKTYEQKVYLKNTCRNFTIFDVIIGRQIQGFVSVFCQSKSLNPDETTQIIVRISSTRTTLIDSNITFIIRGGKTIVLGLKANVIVPKLRIQPQQIDFGSTPVQGNPASRLVTLINQSNIPVDLQLRLQQDTFISRCLRLGQSTDDNILITEASQSKESTGNYLKEHKFNSKSIRITAKSRCQLILEFTPQEVDSYNFILPLFLSNSSEILGELQREIRCKGIMNRLIASQRQVDFGKIIIQQSLQTYQKCQIIQLKNPHEETIEWWVDDNNFFPFTLEKKRGKLQGGQRETIKIFFYNDSPGDYTRELHFFIDQIQLDITKSYLKVLVKAWASYPEIHFSHPYLILPVVNLNEESRATFEIINGGYQNLNLKHVIVQEFSNIDLQLKYINGSNLGVTKKKIGVEIIFISDKPISFTIRIDFYDHSNRVFSIPISGTADNCIYTLIDEELSISNLNQIAISPSVYSQGSTEIERSCSYLKNYMNNMVCSENPLSYFPESLIDSDYERFQAFLCYYSSSYEKLKPNWLKGNNKVSLTYEYFSEIIKNLKSQGAFLNQIRPEFLLPYADYIEILKLHSPSENSTNYYNLPSEETFAVQKKKSWLILFYQIFKVYSRVQVKTPKNNTDFWGKFLLREKTLINWLQQAYQQQAKLEQIKKTDRLTDLNDGQMLSALISKYTNIRILDFYGRPVKNYKEREKRCRKVIETFNQIGINIYARTQDIMRSNPKEMSVLLERLYMVLPSYMQKGQPVTFVCAFGQCLTKGIEITNPSKYPVTYFTKIQGSKAYSIENEHQFTIETKKSHQVKIKYISNINVNNTDATLTLSGKSSTKYTPSTFIFLLKNTTLGRISEKTVQVTGQLYEVFDFNLNVTNNFANDGDFKIEVVGADPNSTIPLAFYTHSATIKVKKGLTVVLNMSFLPFCAENQKCFIIFRDLNVGQFQYEVTGMVNSPQISPQVLRIRQVLYTNKKYQIELQIPQKNDLLLKARKIADSLNENKPDQNRDRKNILKIMSADKNFYPKLSLKDSYTVKVFPSNDMITLKSQQLVMGEVEEEDTMKKEEKKVNLEINMKYPIKQGSFILFMKNSSETDIRKYQVVLNAIYKPLRYELEMKIPVNKTILQPLPMINLTGQNNTYRVSLIQQLNQQTFKNIFSIDCEREVQVRPKDQQVMNLSFKPRAQITYNAVLKMENVTTQQTIEYEIVGQGEEPQAELLVFDQQIRKPKGYLIKLPYTKNSKCMVSTFSLEGAVFDKNFMLTYESQGFKFNYSPKVSGRYQGKLIIEDDQKVHAYRVQINVRDIIQGELKIRALERKRGEAMVKLPLGSWSIVKSDPNIVSPEKFQIVDISQSYMLQYFSIKPEQRVFPITFYSQRIGQISYNIRVHIQEMPQIKFDVFKVELGKTHEEEIHFQNTEDTPMHVQGISTDEKLFYFEPRKIVVPAKSEIRGKIVYRPASLEMEEGKICFKSDKNSKWNYHLSGYGLLQCQEQVKFMDVNFGEDACESIIFTNPFNKTVKVHIFLENEGEQNAFHILLKSSKVDLNYLQELSVPLSLKPSEVRLYSATLKVVINEKIYWRYRLQGRVIYRKEQELKSLKIQCREKKEIRPEFLLNHLPKQNAPQKLQLKIRTLVPELEQRLRHNVRIGNKCETIMKTNNIGFSLHMLSFKPYEFPCEFQISDQNGCKWIERCDVSFLVPPPDDSFQIVTEINRTSTVAFRVTNRVKTFSKFKAYFTSSSNMQFTVSPKNGDLQPYGRNGTLFEVSFAPTQYRNSWQGKLIIETEDSFWSYEVRGSLPQYTPPVGKSLLTKTIHQKTDRID